MQHFAVYRARPEAVPNILGLLKKEGLNPVTLDAPDSVQRFISGFNYLVRIAVPQDEIIRARSALTEWEKSIKPKVDKISHQLSVRVSYALFGLGIIYGVLLLLGQFSVMRILTVILLFSLFPFAYIYNRRKRRRGHGLPLSHSEEDQQSEYISEDSQ